MVSYNFADYLSQVPNYKRKDSTSLQDRAVTASNLIYDPQKSEQERSAQWNEVQHINNMQKLKASNAGVAEALALNNALAKKAAALRAAGSGAMGSSGLSDHLNNQADISTQAQRLSIAAALAANNAAEANNYSALDRQAQGRLREIETLRGETASGLYNQYEDAQDAAENTWRQNALQVALGIGSGALNAADLNQRASNEAARIAEQRYSTDMGYKQALLPYQSMTQYQKGQLDLDTVRTMGQTPNAQNTSPPAWSTGAGSISYNSNNRQNSAVGLRSVAENAGLNVGWDEKTGNVSIGQKTYTPSQLANMGGFIDSDGRWKLPSSVMTSIIG